MLQPRIEVIKEAAGEAVAEVNSQAKSKINARNSSKVSSAMPSPTRLSLLNSSDVRLFFVSV